MVDWKGRERSSNVSDRRFVSPASPERFIRYGSWEPMLNGNVYLPEEQMAYDWQRYTDKNAMSDPLAAMRGAPSSRPMSQRDTGKGSDRREKAAMGTGARQPFPAAPLTLKGGPGIISGSGSNDTLRGGTADKRVIDTIIAEALGEGDAGMTAVAYTILNRSNNRGLTPLQVVKQKSQYSGYSNPGSAVKRAMDDPQVRARVERIWSNVQSGSVPDPTQGGEYFHTTSISPGWSKGVNKHGTTRLGNHVFYLGKGANPVSPVVPPPPNRGTALDAIRALTGADYPTATAYAPPGGSLTTGPAGLPVPAPPPMTPGAPPRAGNALPVLPGRATDLAPVRAANVPPVPSVPPSIDTIQATDLNPDTLAPRGPFGRGRRTPPPPPPRIDEQALTKWAEANYTRTPLNDRGLTTRTVRTIPVPPDSPLAGNTPGLQEALNDLATRRRNALPPVRAADMTFMEINKGRQPGDYPTIPSLPSPTLQPLPSPTILAADLGTDEATRPRGPGGRGRHRNVPDRLTAAPEPRVGTNAFGYPGAPPPPPAPPMPGAIRTGALGTALGAPGEPGVPSWLRKKNGMPPIELNGYTIDPETDRLVQINPPKRTKVPKPPDPPPMFQGPPAGTAAMLKGPGAQFLGGINNGRFPILGGFLKSFLPKEGFGEIATDRDIGFPGFGGLLGRGLHALGNRNATRRGVSMIPGMGSLGPRSGPRGADLATYMGSNDGGSHGESDADSFIRLNDGTWFNRTTGLRHTFGSDSAPLVR